MNTRVNWNGATGDKLINLITTHDSRMVTRACHDIAKRSKDYFGKEITPKALEKAYHSLKRRGRVPTQRSQPSDQNNQRTMTFEQAWEFFEFLKKAEKAGITIR